MKKNKLDNEMLSSPKKDAWDTPDKIGDSPFLITDDHHPMQTTQTDHLPVDSLILQSSIVAI